MARQQSSGTCTLCKANYPKSSMTRHLTKCVTTPEAAPASKKVQQGKLFHIVVEGKYQPEYWLHLELPEDATFGQLDGFLRNIWLECCGHLSDFKIEGLKRPKRLSFADMIARLNEGMEDPDEVDMDAEIGTVLEKGMKLSYQYDYGSTTKLALKVVGEREGTFDPTVSVRLLARNEPPHIPCGNCETASATVIDFERSYDRSGWLCAKCAEEAGLSHEEMTLPVVNSPRTGVCAYTG